MVVRFRLWFVRVVVGMTLMAILLAACDIIGPSPTATLPPPTQTPSFTPLPTHTPTETPTPTQTPTPTPTSTPTISPTPTAPSALVPNFSHVIVIFLENREFGRVVGQSEMANFNRWAEEYTLLSQHYAVTHPSLPNYIAMVSGDTQGIDTNCEDCFVDAPNLADLLEQSGYTWRTYQEDMPFPCFIGSSTNYAQKHNPFIYFDSIRLDEQRCQQSIVPLTELENDLANGVLPDFSLITPNMCNSGHDCDLSVSDAWLAEWVGKITASPSFDERSLLILTWDEGQGNHSCCGLPEEAGGRVATILISGLVKPGFVDETPYSHYSILKTIAEAWGLKKLGHAADEETALIVAPWVK